MGGGQAAGEVAFRLRHKGYTGAITIIGSEAHLPYQRPPLSKAFLSGTATSDDLLLRPKSSYERASIRFMGSTLVESLNPPARSVTLSDGQVLAYDKLILATGGRPRRLLCPGSDLAGVHVLRTLDDVLGIRKDFQPGTALAIIGGGYIGLEVAAVAVKAGLKVTLIEAAPRLLARVTGTEMSIFFESVHRGAGVDVHTGVGVTGLLPAPLDPARIGAVQLSDERRFPADCVLVGVGIVPNVELAEDAGLPTNNGILVDEFCLTQDPDVLAIGDCANHPNQLFGRRLRLESVPNAVEQARVAADTICGSLKPYAAIPWFWSDQYDLKLQAVGLADGHDQTVVRGDPAGGAFSIFYLRQGTVIAADSVNRPSDFIAAKSLVGRTIRTDASLLADMSQSLKVLVAHLSAVA